MQSIVHKYNDCVINVQHLRTFKIILFQLSNPQTMTQNEA